MDEQNQSCSGWKGGQELYSSGPLVFPCFSQYILEAIGIFLKHISNIIM